MLGLMDLTLQPALDHLDLTAEPVARTLAGWPGASEVRVARIDPGLADTAAMVEAYDLPLAASANCVVVAGTRGDDERIAACVVAADTRADVNKLVRKLLDVRKASFLPMERATAESGMEYGGITPVGLPSAWRLLVDSRLLQQEEIIVGAGVRGAKLFLPGRLLADLPGAEVVERLGT